MHFFQENFFLDSLELVFQYMEPLHFELFQSGSNNAQCMKSLVKPIL